jgi:mannose-6-phosphate isomerase-like protein (cupin superfamily)
LAAPVIRLSGPLEVEDGGRTPRIARLGGTRPKQALRKDMTVIDTINLAEKLGLFTDQWQPKLVARFNENNVLIVKVQGEFVWHKHDDTDDFFLVLDGHLTIQLRDRNVELDAGELFVVPRGVEHCPRADEEASILLIEPAGTVNTGDAGGPRTTEPQPI